jgi:hypothetical protein
MWPFIGGLDRPLASGTILFLGELSGRGLLGFLNPRDFYEDGVLRLTPGPVFAIAACEEAVFEPFCACSHSVVDPFLHSVWAFWE